MVLIVKGFSRGKYKEFQREFVKLFVIFYQSAPSTAIFVSVRTHSSRSASEQQKYTTECEADPKHTRNPGHTRYRTRSATVRSSRIRYASGKRPRIFPSSTIASSEVTQLPAETLK